MRAIPEDNLGYPVLITLDSGNTGSGFYLRLEPFLFLVTAKHVLLNDAGKLRSSKATALSYGRQIADASKTVIHLDLDLLQSANIGIDPAHDLAIIRIGKLDGERYSNPIGVAFQSLAPSGIVTVAENTIHNFDAVMISNPVIIFGYPISLGLSHLPQFEYDRPLLRSGIVAGKNLKKRTIVIDCPSYPGNSGGLVMQIEQEGLQLLYRAVGVVSEYIPALQPWFDAKGTQQGSGLVNSGYSIVTPVDYVRQLAAALPLDNKSS